MKLIILSIGLITIAFLGLAINIIFKKNGRFPQTEIGKNRDMRRLGISCAKCDEKKRCKKHKS